jgi:hypothetical protein
VGRGWKGGRGRGFEVLFFLFFQILFKQLFKTLFKIKNFTFFLQLVSQIILKTFKSTQQQTHAFQHDAQTLGYF